MAPLPSLCRRAGSVPASFIPNAEHSFLFMREAEGAHDQTCTVEEYSNSANVAESLLLDILHLPLFFD